MINTNENKNSQTSIIELDIDYKPPRTLRSWLIGRPLSTADASHQTIGKVVGLAVFASDALSSTAYATQEILGVIAAAGTIAYGYLFPISLAIITLLAIVTISYEQTIHAYPGGGGAYIVARDNLGELPAQTAGAALLTDYILTVSVSISAGVAQIVSAYPELFPYRVAIAVIAVLLVMLVNLRGVKESGTAFAIPTYFFVVLMVATVGYGIFRYFTGSLGMVVDPPHFEASHVISVITPFILLHAFANGTTALTGVEAISNGITAFKEPRSKNAGITLVWMSLILGALFLGLSFLTGKVHAVFSEEETVISQLARTIYGGRGIPYLMLLTGTTVILIMAANTAFADFPRLGALHAGDGFLPRQLTYRGSRLVYSRGIVSLAIIASLLIIIFQASVTRLIPLYAIGVFLSFTLSQAGMARRWWKIGHLKEGVEIVEPGSTLKYESGWQYRMLINGFGAICTAVVMVVFAVTKFSEGAWVVLILTPVLVGIFFSIHHHYKGLAKKLSLDNFGAIPPQAIRHRVIVPVSGVHQGTLAALHYARMLSDDITAVHVTIEPAEAEKVRQKWETWGEGVRIVMLASPYRLFLEPLLGYISAISRQRQPGETITIVVPEFVSDSRVTALLHTNTADLLRSQLKRQHGIVIINVPYHVHE
ncbi:MAG: amino acid permease [Anaerolineales bacterium]|uniref:APC family permease n=1 Tax=Candidatus Villigracilis affinis TaxID=3140682 RepID=UPI002A1C6D6D|nr:amino acid permease [Anaerolineales bacterium]MBL0344962.1 amino acid permease [Anaerolineales bacterium]